MASYVKLKVGATYTFAGIKFVRGIAQVIQDDELVKQFANNSRFTVWEVIRAVDHKPQVAEVKPVETVKPRPQRPKQKVGKRKKSLSKPANRESLV